MLSATFFLKLRSCDVRDESRDDVERASDEKVVVDRAKAATYGCPNLVDLNTNACIKLIGTYSPRWYQDT